MVQVEIEKEIKQENRIFGRFTGRQVVCFGIVAAVEIAFYLIVHPEIDAIIFAGILLGIGAWYFGFHKKCGINMEYFLGKKIKAFILSNTSRKYRTKNKYIRTLNTSYLSDKSKDMANKRTKRALQKQQKANAKAKKSSKIKSYA